MTPRSDPPPERIRPDPEAHAFLAESAVNGRIEDVNRAKCFFRVDRGLHWVAEQCGSLVEYGARLGFGSNQTLDYLAAGKVFEACPEAETFVVEGRLPVGALAIIAPYFLDPAMRPVHEPPDPKAGEPWSDKATLIEELLFWASFLSEAKLRRHVLLRERDVTSGETTVATTLALTAQGRMDLKRTRELEMRRKKRVVSRSEAAEAAFRTPISSEACRSTTRAR